MSGAPPPPPPPPRQQSWRLHVKCEATETLQNIPVRAALISAVAYLPAGADRRLRGVFTLSPVQLNPFAITSEISFITTVQEIAPSQSRFRLFSVF